MRVFNGTSGTNAPLYHSYIYLKLDNRYLNIKNGGNEILGRMLLKMETISYFLKDNCHMYNLGFIPDILTKMLF